MSTLDNLDFSIDNSPKEEFGDLSTNIAMIGCKFLKSLILNIGNFFLPYIIMNSNYIVYGAIASYLVYNLYKMRHKPVCRKCKKQIDNVFALDSIKLCYTCYTKIEPLWNQKYAKFFGVNDYFENMFMLGNIDSYKI